MRSFFSFQCPTSTFRLLRLNEWIIGHRRRPILPDWGRKSYYLKLYEERKAIRLLQKNDLFLFIPLYLLTSIRTLKCDAFKIIFNCNLFRFVVCNEKYFGKFRFVGNCNHETMLRPVTNKNWIVTFLNSFRCLYFQKYAAKVLAARVVPARAAVWWRHAQSRFVIHCFNWVKMLWFHNAFIGKAFGRFWLKEATFLVNKNLKWTQIAEAHQVGFCQ